MNMKSQTFAPCSHIFSAVVDRIEEKRAVLQTTEGETCELPFACMPEETSEGDVVRISVERMSEETAHRAREAKEILNDILHTKHP